MIHLAGAGVAEKKWSADRKKEIIERKGDSSIQHQLKKIENETENFEIKKIPIELSKEITLIRNIQKISQKDIAIKLNIQQNIYNELENGKAIYNSQTKELINKIERLFKTKFLHLCTFKMLK